MFTRLTKVFVKTEFALTGVEITPADWRNDVVAAQPFGSDQPSGLPFTGTWNARRAVSTLRAIAICCGSTSSGIRLSAILNAASGCWSVYLRPFSVARTNPSTTFPWLLTIVVLVTRPLPARLTYFDTGSTLTGWP